MTHADRIAVLRQRLLDRKDADEIGFLRENALVSARALRESEDLDSWQVRRGLQTQARLAAMQFDLDDLELLAGRLRLGHRDGPDQEYDDARAYLEQYPPHKGQTGHCELDFEPVMTLGVDGIARDVRERLATATGVSADAYQSFLDVLDGFSRMCENAAATAESALESASDARREELSVIAKSCRRIAHAPPQSFRDAIQLLWLITLGAMHGDFSVHLVVPGHLDRTLRPFYETDRDKGLLTRDDALVLIESVYLLVNEYVADGLAMSVMVGGRDPEGRDVTNDLSYLCLEALRRTRLIYPAVGVCWHDDTPMDLIELAVDLIGHGISTPAFFGDETIQRGLKALGVPPDEACHYINSTCVEITPARGSNVWVASPYYSLCRHLLDEVAHRAANGAPMTSFDDFRDRCLERLFQNVTDEVAKHNEVRLHRQRYGRKPFQSVFTRDCIAQGRDIDDGGARYNWIECSFVGIANFVDSLHVIQEEIYNKKRLTFGELKAVLDADFEGHEAERMRFFQGYPKYGQNHGEVDVLFDETVKRIRLHCAQHRMEPDGSSYVPGAFCWIMHEVLGSQCGATPDGRKAGAAFADGCGPAQGRERHGPTAAILSTTSWDHAPMIGGLAYNMKFSSSLFRGPEGFAGLRDLVLTFLRRGGFETQINVVDLETLKNARKHPDDYRDLMVRIGGYADYFTRLSPAMQDEIILRTEFAQV